VAGKDEPGAAAGPAVVLMADAEFGGEVVSVLAGRGTPAEAVSSVDAAYSLIARGARAVLLDASFAAEAVPLMAKARETGARILVAGTALQGAEALRLIEAGAWGFFPLPQRAQAVAARLENALSPGEEEAVSFSGLARIKAELAGVFDTIPSALVVVSPAGEIRRANRAALALLRGVEIYHIPEEELKAALGYLKGGGFSDLFRCDAATARKLGDALREGREAEVEFEMKAASGASLLLRAKCFGKGSYSEQGTSLGDGRLIVVEDITQRRRQEEIRARSQKLEAVALLAATLSHEINQPLGSILGRAQLALMGLDEKPPELEAVRRDLDEIVDAVARVRSILDRLHRVADIVTKPYLGDAEILDLEKSAAP
jgi:signal transduction histidine kinase